MGKGVYVLSAIFGMAAAVIAFLLTDELLISLAGGFLTTGMLLAAFMIAQRRSEGRVQAVLQTLGCTVRYRCEGNLQAPDGVFYCVLCLTDDGITFLIERYGDFQPEHLPKEQILRYLTDETVAGLAIDTVDGRRYVLHTAARQELFSQLQQMGWI